MQIERRLVGWKLQITSNRAQFVLVQDRLHVWSDLPDGEHAVSIRATDRSGARLEREFYIYVQRPQGLVDDGADADQLPADPDAGTGCASAAATVVPLCAMLLARRRRGR